MLSFSKSALCLLLASPLIAAVVAAGCSDTATTGTAGNGTTQSASSSGDVGGGGSGSASGGSGGTGATGGGSSGTAGSGAGTPVIVNCQNQTYECGDTLDNDGDGLTDWQDPDCLGPCDNSEKGLDLAIPGGDGPDCTVDCYWDSNSGSGNDGCYWNHQCDILSPEGTSVCPYNMDAKTPGTNLSCSELLNNQPSTCLEYCPKLVPNGCDCFGCCVLWKDGKQYGPVWLGTENPPGSKIFSCELDKLGALDQDANCNPCTQVKNDCYNDCGKCELCIGKTPADLPPECFNSPPPDGGPPPPDSGTDSGTPPPQCPDGVQPCGLQGQELCNAGYSCLTGCCIQNPK